MAKATKSKGSTNLNTVRINLGDVDLYEIVYHNTEWWEKNAPQARKSEPA